MINATAIYFATVFPIGLAILAIGMYFDSKVPTATKEINV